MDVARELLNDSLDNLLRNTLERPAPEPTEPQGSTHKEQQGSQPSVRSSSSYTLASDQSVFSRDVEHWIRGGSTETTGIQGSSAAVTQRSTLITNDTMQGTGFWYILAIVLPLFSFSDSNHWRCSPSTILNTAEFFVTQVGRVCSQVRYQIRRLANNQMSRELFATAMDVVLVVYAIGFLILSMYQASIIG